MPNAMPLKCPICDMVLTHREESLGATFYQCSRCGNFTITGINLLATALVEGKLGAWDMGFRQLE